MIHRLAAAAVALALLACGGERPLLATISFPAEVSVRLDWPGNDAASVEAALVVPVERALAAVPGAAHVRSVAWTDAAEVRLGFTGEEAARAAATAVRERLETLLPSLPEGVALPRVAVLGVDPVWRLVLVHDGTRVELGGLAARLVERIQPLAGVRMVTMCGGATRARSIELNPARLAALAVTASEVAGVLERELAAARAPGFVAASLEDLGKLLVAQAGASPVRLADVALLREDALAAPCQATRGGRDVALMEVAVGRNLVAAAPALAEVAADAAPGLAVELLPPAAGLADVEVRDREPRWPAGTWPPAVPDAAVAPGAGVRIAIDRERAALLGVRGWEIARTVRLASVGVGLGDSGGVPMTVRVGAGDPETPWWRGPIAALGVRGAGGVVPLDQLITLSAVATPGAILRQGGARLPGPSAQDGPRR